MLYYLDGYNILFSLSDSIKPLEPQRKELITYLQTYFAAKKLKGLLVFDGKVRLDEQSGRAYPSPLEIVYTEKGESADSYILHQIEISKSKSEITVVTNDQGLKTKLRYWKIPVTSVTEFIKFLEKKEDLTDKKPTKDSSKNIARLRKIFEDT